MKSDSIARPSDRIALKNTQRRMLAFNLPHESYCRALGACACRVVRRMDMPESVPGRRVCASLTVLATATARDLPRAVLAVPEIARAVADGTLRTVA